MWFVKYFNFSFRVKFKFYKRGSVKCQYCATAIRAVRYLFFFFNLSADIRNVTHLDSLHSGERHA
jgi:hypothetical protein